MYIYIHEILLVRDLGLKVVNIYIIKYESLQIVSLSTSYLDVRICLILRCLLANVSNTNTQNLIV